MTTIQIPDDWTPTLENLSQLPLPLRQYIQNLQTKFDPVETMRENFILRQEIDALRRECSLMSGMLGRELA
jgi:hypothetical protein